MTGLVGRWSPMVAPLLARFAARPADTWRDCTKLRAGKEAAVVGAWPSAPLQGSPMEARLRTTPDSGPRSDRPSVAQQSTSSLLRSHHVDG